MATRGRQASRASGRHAAPSIHERVLHHTLHSDPSARACLSMYPIISRRASGEFSTVYADSSPSLPQPLGGEEGRGDAERWQWPVGIAAGNVRRTACVAEMEREVNSCDPAMARPDRWPSRRVRGLARRRREPALEVRRHRVADVARDVRASIADRDASRQIGDVGAVARLSPFDDDEDAIVGHVSSYARWRYAAAARPAKVSSLAGSPAYMPGVIPAGRATCCISLPGL